MCVCVFQFCILIHHSLPWSAQLWWNGKVTLIRMWTETNSSLSNTWLIFWALEPHAAVLLSILYNQFLSVCFLCPVQIHEWFPFVYFLMNIFWNILWVLGSPVNDVLLYIILSSFHGLTFIYLFLVAFTMYWSVHIIFICFCSSEQSSGANLVVICNIHVLYNPKRGEIKLGQVLCIL